MTPIKNIKPLTAQALFNILKSDFVNYINLKLDSTLSIDYAHVANVINVLFPDVIDGIAFSIIISDEEIRITENNISPQYNTGLLEEHLTDFLTLKAG